MFRSVRPFALEAGTDGPVVCYQGALVADARTGEVLRHLPIPLELAREAIRAIEEAGHGVNCLRGRRALRRRDHARGAVLRRLPGRAGPIHAVGDLLDWLDRPPTKLVIVGRAGAARPARGCAARGASPSACTSSAVAAVLPRGRRRGGDEGRRPRRPAPSCSASRPSARSRSATARTTSSCSTWAGYGVAVANAHPRAARARRLRLPVRGRGGRRTGDRGVFETGARDRPPRSPRNDPERYRAALARKGAAEAFDDAARRRRALALARARASTTCARARSSRAGRRRSRSSELKAVKEELQQVEAELAEAEAARDELLRQVPNPPHDSAPDGDTDEDAEELRRVGEPPALEDPREHTVVGRFDMERAAQGLRLALRLPGRRHRAARARALPLRARPPATQPASRR